MKRVIISLLAGLLAFAGCDTGLFATKKVDDSASNSRAFSIPETVIVRYEEGQTKLPEFYKFSPVEKSYQMGKSNEFTVGNLVPDCCGTNIPAVYEMVRNSLRHVEKVKSGDKIKLDIGGEIVLKLFSYNISEAFYSASVRGFDCRMDCMEECKSHGGCSDDCDGTGAKIAGRAAPTCPNTPDGRHVWGNYNNDTFGGYYVCDKCQGISRKKF